MANSRADPTARLEKKRLPVVRGLFHLPSSAAEEPYLIGSKCRLCGLVVFPRRVVCPLCVRDDTMEVTPLSRRGRLRSFTLCMVASPGFAAPYFQAYVDLPEGVTLFSLITGCEPKEEALQEGMEMELVLEKVGEDERGNELIGYKFRPVESSPGGGRL